MTQLAATQACDMSAVLSRKLAAAHAEEAALADRLSALETELALNAERLSNISAVDRATVPPSLAHRHALLNRRIVDLKELRASLIANRAKRRRMIDELTQRKEAIDAALAVLRQQTSSRDADAP